MSTTYTVTLAVDHHEGAEFAAWLNAHGHNASVGRDTGNHVVEADDENDESDILRSLWDSYCRGA